MIYSPPKFLFNAHLETIYPSLFRKVDFQFLKTENIATPDDDFLEVGISTHNSDSVVIISHGLEGSMQRPYIRGMARACFQAGYDVLGWSYRGCGSAMNRQLRFYHSGATDDLHTVVNYALLRYKTIYLVGFSLGGNITLKYLGEERERSPAIKKAVVVSVPLDLKASCEKISEPSNRIYSNRFLKSLKNKVISKSKFMKGIDVSGIHYIKTLQEFDDRYTAPLHGFPGALDYYYQCSSIRFIDSIRVPTLIVNAKNDPFLSPECFPEKQLNGHAFVKFESPEHGGHVGFAQFKNGLYWSEQRAVEFFSS